MTSTHSQSFTPFRYPSIAMPSEIFESRIVASSSYSSSHTSSQSLASFYPFADRPPLLVVCVVVVLYPARGFVFVFLHSIDSTAVQECCSGVQKQYYSVMERAAWSCTRGVNKNVHTISDIPLTLHKRMYKRPQSPSRWVPSKQAIPNVTGEHGFGGL